MAAVYTGETTILSVNSEDLLFVFKDATLTLETDSQDARYAMQDWEDPVGRISRWSLDINTIVDSAEGIQLAGLLAGPPIPVIFEDRSAGGIHLEGNVLMLGFTRTLPDSDGLTNAIRLKGKGEPTISMSS
jgi:hypothetical protein